MSTSNKPKVFITHSWHDIEFARRLRDDLVARGYEVWFDDKALKGGHRMAEEINHGLAWCDVYIPILSPQALESPWCMEEIDAAFSLSEEQGGRLQIIPVIAENVRLKAQFRGRLPINLANLYSTEISKVFSAIDESVLEREARAGREAEESARQQQERQARYESERRSSESVGSPPPMTTPGKMQREREPVLFSAYYPVAVRREQEYKTFAYIFRESLSKVVFEDAGKQSSIMTVQMGSTTAHSQNPIPAGAFVTAELDLPGFRVNPARITIKFQDPWYRFDFTIRATAQLPSDRFVTGRFTFLMNGIIVAGLAFSVFVTQVNEQPKVESKRTEPYQAVFCSYSRKDTVVVERVESVCESLGMKYLRDVTTLRSGEYWDARLLQLIDQADIFQLFWSKFSAQSPAVKKEWEHALTLKDKGDAFIRPVYWREPLMPPPQPLQHINFAYFPELAKEENPLQKFKRTIQQFGFQRS